jgi:hypothetical protein
VADVVAERFFTLYPHLVKDYRELASGERIHPSSDRPDVFAWYVARVVNGTASSIHCLLPNPQMQPTGRVGPELRAGAPLGAAHGRLRLERVHHTFCMVALVQHPAEPSPCIIPQSAGAVPLRGRSLTWPVTR